MTKLGRPLTYQDNYPEVLFELMSHGKKGAALHAHFNITRKTFYEWTKKYEDFADAYERGWEQCQKWWEEFGRQKMLEGDEKGYKYWQTFMRANFGWDRNENAQSGPQININNLQINHSLSKDELIKLIKNDLQELNVLDVQIDTPVQIEVQKDDNGSI